MSGEIVFLEALEREKNSGILRHLIGKVEEKRKKKSKKF